MIRVLLFILGAGIVSGLAWLCGFNFDERGFEMGYTAFMSLVFGVVFATMPQSIIDSIFKK